MSGGRKGIVAAGSVHTARAALTILEAGGNAFDAAVAAFFAACVAEPVLASPGGGGFLLANRSGEPVLYDFFTQTPLKQSKAELDFFPVHADFGTTTQEFHLGLGSCATPGAIRGISMVWRDCCRMPLKELIEPAFILAKNGFIVEDFLPILLEVVSQIYLASPEARKVFSSKTHPGKILQEGECLIHPEMALFLEALASEGEDFFYRGEVARNIVQSCQERGGHLTLEDFDQYQAHKRQPLKISYRGASIWTNPPPSLGGTLIALALRLIANSSFSNLEFGALAHLEILARTMQLTGRLKRESAGQSLGGPDSAEKMLDKNLLSSYQAILTHHDVCTSGTTHISIIDAEGNVAALNLSNGSGSGIMAPGCGFMLNNMLGEEDLNPAGFHQWRQDTRIASMMSPTFIFSKKGLLATGSGGSNRIRSAILQIILNSVDFAMDVSEAVNSPRIHYENGLLNLEGGFPPAVTEQMEERFPKLKLWPDRNLYFGGTHTVFHHVNGEMEGAGDPRRMGVCLNLD